MVIVKQMWIDECEAIVEACVDGHITRSEAVEQLEAKGWDRGEAEDELSEVRR